jgi:hypothetical protein
MATRFAEFAGAVDGEEFFMPECTFLAWLAVKSIFERNVLELIKTSFFGFG